MTDEVKPVDAFAMGSGVPLMEGEIRPKPKYADRVHKRVLLVGAALIVLMIGIFFLALDGMDQKKGKTEAENNSEKKFTETIAPKDLTEPPDSDGLGGSVAGASLVGSATKAQVDLSGGVAGGTSLTNTPAGQDATLLTDNGLGARSAGADAAPMQPPPPTPEEQAANLAKQTRLQRMAQARSNGLGAKAFTTEETKAGSNSATAAVEAAMKNLAMATTGLGAGGMTPTSMPLQQGGKDDSEQDEKRRFLQGPDKSDNHYLPYKQQPPVSPNVLKRGAYLPLRLEGAINSGQPGMVRARVIEDVYDTVTGCRLLVPAMTVVQGEYDSKVAIGQTRNLVVWNYMGFEDGSDLTLGRMQGYDSSGAAGIEADVDNHYMRLFGAAFGLSIVTAGVQMSVPPTPTGTTAQTPQQSIANALTQQYGQLGAQLLGKYLQVQPTLRNYPGERFMVMLPLNIVFKKVWRDRCGGG